jgi:predicted 3-demethylubiquinone-9 3-methyltransferase (glyoxalase superfamily)
MRQKIVPCLWFDKEAQEAAGFYGAVFPDSRLERVTVLRNTPSGDVDLVWFTVGGQPFQAMSAGPVFRFTPAISFLVNFDPQRSRDARERLDATWARLSDGGKVLMPLDAYPFSPHYGWVQDRYGVSWQLILADPAGEPRPFITPFLLFTGKRCGQAEEAGAFWRSLFDGSRSGSLVRHPAGAEPDRAGTVLFSDFRVGDTWIAAMDSAFPHGFDFNEAISFVVPCRDQAEMDRLWTQLSAVPEAEACGWCKDRYGVSWQIVPAALDRMMASGDQARVDRVTQAVLGMKKLDLAALEAAFAGRTGRDNRA